MWYGLEKDTFVTECMRVLIPLLYNQEKDLFPLRDSFFEGTAAKIPYEYSKLLTDEYGTPSLTRTEFARHKWNQTSMLWEPMK